MRTHRGQPSGQLFGLAHLAVQDLEKMQYLLAHRFLAPLNPLRNKLWAYSKHLGEVLLPDPTFDAPLLYSFDDFFGSLAHTSNISRYTIGVNISCAYYTQGVALAATRAGGIHAGRAVSRIGSAATRAEILHAGRDDV